MQQVDAGEPVRIAPEKSAAHAHRRDARDVGAVGKCRTDHIELVFDAEHAAPKRQHVYLTLELAATENRIALGIDGLFDRTIRIATCVERVIAQDACQPPEYEIVESRVISSCFKTDWALRVSEADP